MRLSRYFLPVLKETPADAEIASHRLMLRAGMIRQSASGIYSWLPLGYRVLQRIEQIVREEQNRAGAVEMLMPTIQSADLWRESGRYDDYGAEMLRIQDRKERDLLYGPTNEELITEIFRSYCRSYKDVPKLLYHIQWKFRDEIRPRFGVMRGREFLMKDTYSFDINEAAARHSYNKMFAAYLNTFERMGLKAVPMRADTGPIGGDLSHEFIILAETGESEVFCEAEAVNRAAPGADTDFDDVEGLEKFVAERTKLYAATDEMHEPDRFAAIPEDQRVQARGIEVGHIFYFGAKYSEPMRAMLQTPDGQSAPVHMGSYGVGVSRLVGAVIEASHDENGIIWPEGVAPFHAGIVNLKPGNAEADGVCQQFYDALNLAGREPLLDDTDERPGAKFARMDLIGLPWQVVVGPRGLKDGVVELKCRATGERETLSPESAISRLMESNA